MIELMSQFLALKNCMLSKHHLCFGVRFVKRSRFDLDLPAMTAISEILIFFFGRTTLVMH